MGWAKFGVLVGTLSVVLRQCLQIMKPFRFEFFKFFSNEFQAHSKSGPPTS
jgi:hypothetical protein